MEAELRAALERIVALPMVRHRGSGRDRYGELVSVREAQEIAVAALAACPAPVRDGGDPLVEALRFYADEANWHEHDRDHYDANGEVVGTERVPVAASPAVARAALSIEDALAVHRPVRDGLRVAMRERAHCAYHDHNEKCECRSVGCLSAFIADRLADLVEAGRPTKGRALAVVSLASAPGRT